MLHHLGRGQLPVDISYPPLSHTYTLPIFIIGIMILIIHKSIRIEIELELLYGKLKKSTDDKKTVLTETTEQKLDEVVNFINENYTSDISREGLANAIDMSTDHMSRTFKAQYGKRINDYINELRVMDAARQLRETDRKVADIAFSVGFESITTFNRAFQKVLNVTPSDYKYINRS
jgi:transcriptional regulator GlxA family with amidase domain